MRRCDAGSPERATNLNPAKAEIAGDSGSEDGNCQPLPEMPPLDRSAYETDTTNPGLWNGPYRVSKVVPGIQVHQNAPGNYIVSLRGTNGLSGNNTIVMIDGVPINSPIDQDRPLRALIFRTPRTGLDGATYGPPAPEPPPPKPPSPP